MQALLNVKAAGTYSDHSALKGLHLAVLLYYRSLCFGLYPSSGFFKVLIVLKLLDLTVNKFRRMDLPSFDLGPPDQAEDAPSFFFA
jgi:hypothetical protein